MKKQPKKSVERILSQESFTGADLGKLFLADWAESIHGKHIFSQADINTICNYRLPYKQAAIFEQYKEAQSTLSDIYSNYRLSYLKFMQGKSLLKLALKDIEARFLLYWQYVQQPLLMSSDDYSRLRKKAEAAYRSGEVPLNTAVIFAAARYVRSMLYGGDVPDGIRKAFDALKDKPVKGGNEAVMLAELLRCFAERYDLPDSDEKTIRSFILDATSFDTGFKDAIKMLPVDLMIGSFEAVVTSSCKAAGIEPDAGYVSAYMKDLKKPVTDKQGLLVKMCGILGTSSPLLYRMTHPDADATAESFIMQFKPFLTTTARELAGKLDEFKGWTPEEPGPIKEKKLIQAGFIEEPVEGELVRSFYLSSVKGTTRADFIRRAKARAGIFTGDGPATEKEKKLIAKFSKFVFLNKDQAEKSKDDFDYWIKTGLFFVYGSSTMFDVYGDFLGVNLSVVKMSDDMIDTFKDYNDAVLRAYIMAAGTPEEASYVRGKIKEVFRKLEESDFKMQPEARDALVKSLEEKDLKDLNELDTMSKFFPEEARVSYGRK